MSGRWQFLRSTPLRAMGKLTLREDRWRLPTGVERAFVLSVGSHDRACVLAGAEPVILDLEEVAHLLLLGAQIAVVARMRCRRDRL